MTMHYYLKDHEGNVRVVADQTGTVEQVNHYYPFGGLMGMSVGSSVQPYKYNGKELDRSNGLDLYDYGARWYNAITFNAASVTGMLKVAGMAISSFRGGKITQYRSVGSNFLSGDPVNTFQDLTRRPSLGRVIPVKVGKNFSHGIQDIINAFHRKR